MPTARCWNSSARAEWQNALSAPAATARTTTAARASAAAGTTAPASAVSAARGLVYGLYCAYDLLRLLAAEAERVGRLGKKRVAFNILQFVELVPCLAHFLSRSPALLFRYVGKRAQLLSEFVYPRKKV